jgi:pyruvate/2-oxoglutarate dehydrogenase complex dihydrolipoamide dehydrogenase (E3) component
VVLGAGRSPRVDYLGLDTVGVEREARGVAVDEHCQVAPGLWAVGDVTGAALVTHVAKYQARVVAQFPTYSEAFLVGLEQLTMSSAGTDRGCA